jgi:hypothetical protein
LNGRTTAVKQYQRFSLAMDFIIEVETVYVSEAFERVVRHVVKIKDILF